MKKIAVFIIMICLCSFYNPLRAAFVINHPKAETASIHAMNAENLQNSSLNISPKEPLVNPEHALADIITLAAFGLGILALLFSLSSGFALVLGFFAVVLGIAGSHMEGHKKLAKLGLVFGAIAMAIALIVQYVSF